MVLKKSKSNTKIEENTKEHHADRSASIYYAKETGEFLTYLYYREKEVDQIATLNSAYAYGLALYWISYPEDTSLYH